MAPALALLALLFEAAFGYPDRLFARIGHPVTWIGALVSRLDRKWNRDDSSVIARQRAGLAAIAVVGAAALIVGAGLQWLATASLGGVLLVALAASTLLAQRSLGAHVADVADALETGGLPLGRCAVARIVGRDPDRLDEAGVARAAIESLAENFSDGVVAPAFWLAALGVPGGLAYKAINTADSMIGHRTARHCDFGRAAAKIDDMVNWPASRLCGLLLVAAAALTPGAEAGSALRVMRRDARFHKSPNAGWPEAAMAGALGVSLAGPRHYDGVCVEDAEMNVGARRAVGPDDIRRALRLYRNADALLIALVGLWVAVTAII